MSEFSASAYRPTELDVDQGRMLFDASHDSLGQGQCLTPFDPAHQGRPPCSDRFDKSLEFRPQGLNRLSLQLPESQARRIAIVGHVQYQNVAAGEIY